MDPKEPDLPPNHLETYEPEPVKALPYTGPKPMTVLVPGKPNNRRYRRAEAKQNKKNGALFNKQVEALMKRTKNDVLGKMAAAKQRLETLLQTTPETASDTAPQPLEPTP